MICLTFDTDWMSDAAMARFLREFPVPGRATFFLHDSFPSLMGSAHELCPHPFIEDLRNWKSTVTKAADNVPPSPKGIRPHACVFSHAIAVGLRELGYRYVSQASMLHDPRAAPVRHPWGIWELPIYYMDNMDFWAPGNWPEDRLETFRAEVLRHALDGEGVYVFDFHPLHIALNTRTPADYAAVKDRILKGESPFDLAYPGRGTRTFFLELCAAMRERDLPSMACWDALTKTGAR
jgi:hypothetical protein